jgi:hypothetical protein
MPELLGLFLFHGVGMEAKPWIWMLGRFLSLPFIVVAAIAMIVWHLVITFWFACCAAYITIRRVYEWGAAPEESRRPS